MPFCMKSERTLGFVERTWHLEAFFIYHHVDQRSLQEYDAVHHAEEWVVLKMRNSRIPREDAYTDRNEFPCEYYTFMDGVEQLDIELQAAQILAGNPQSGDSNCASTNKIILHAHTTCELHICHAKTGFTFSALCLEACPDCCSPSQTR